MSNTLKRVPKKGANKKSITRSAPSIRHFRPALFDVNMLDDWGFMYHALTYVAQDPLDPRLTTYQGMQFVDPSALNQIQPGAYDSYRFVLNNIVNHTTSTIQRKPLEFRITPEAVYQEMYYTAHPRPQGSPEKLEAIPAVARIRPHYIGIFALDRAWQKIDSNVALIGHINGYWRVYLEYDKSSDLLPPKVVSRPKYIWSKQEAYELDSSPEQRHIPATESRYLQYLHERIYALQEVLYNSSLRIGTAFKKIGKAFAEGTLVRQMNLLRWENSTDVTLSAIEFAVLFEYVAEDLIEAAKDYGVVTNPSAAESEHFRDFSNASPEAVTKLLLGLDQLLEAKKLIMGPLHKVHWTLSHFSAEEWEEASMILRSIDRDI